MSSPLDPSKSLRIAGTLIRLTKTLDQEVRGAPSGDGLDLVSLITLAQVERGVDLPSLIARSLKLDPGRVTRVMDHLVGFDYVERYDDADDRRRCRLRITESGRVRLRAGKTEMVNVMTRLMAPLSEDERASFEQALETVRASLDTGAES